MKTYAVVFASVLLAELGDKTQLATLLFATNPGLSRTGIFLAAAGALATSTLLAVAIGTKVGHLLDPALVRKAAGVAFLVIGAWMLLTRG
jgi:putative Ca2+/H+ antiporter (TMEM165/GDT1 family)